MTDEEAALRLLAICKRIFTQPNTYQLKSAVSMRFIFQEKDSDAWERALAYAVEQGWLRVDGRNLLFTQAGFDKEI